MEPELQAVLGHIADVRCVRAAGRDFYLGHWYGQQVAAVLSRVGKVAAATTATTLIERFGTTAIVFTGVAGALAANVNIGDAVIARDFVQHDMNATPLFPRYEVPLYERSSFVTDPGLSQQLAQAARTVLIAENQISEAQNKSASSRRALLAWQSSPPTVHQGLVLSGDSFVATRTQREALLQALPAALAVEMEGAAIAQVCFDYDVPMAAVRIISDRADDSAHVDFAEFINTVASHYSASIIDAFIASRAS
jgi:adenosylhomocysteine nucleosidase